MLPDWKFQSFYVPLSSVPRLHHIFQVKLNWVFTWLRRRCCSNVFKAAAVPHAYAAGDLHYFFFMCFPAVRDFQFSSVIFGIKSKDFFNDCRIFFFFLMTECRLVVAITVKKKKKKCKWVDFFHFYVNGCAKALFPPPRRATAARSESPSPPPHWAVREVAGVKRSLAPPRLLFNGRALSGPPAWVSKADDAAAAVCRWGGCRERTPAARRGHGNPARCYVALSRRSPAAARRRCCFRWGDRWACGKGKDVLVLLRSHATNQAAGRFGCTAHCFMVRCVIPWNLVLIWYQVNKRPVSDTNFWIEVDVLSNLLNLNVFSGPFFCCGLLICLSAAIFHKDLLVPLLVVLC